MINSSVGISTACWYPIDTELSLIRAGECGFKNVELFINSFREFEDVYIDKFNDIKNSYNIDIVSVHPFTSFSESFCLFGDYKRRSEDAFFCYDKFLKASNKLGAKLFVIHGMKKPGAIDIEEYAERMNKLIVMGEKYDITVCHENVANHCCESPHYMCELKKIIGDKFKIVLDNKQALRAGFSPFDFIFELSDSIEHVHISDNTEENDCVPPFEGKFDINKFLYLLNKSGYDKNYVIELYKKSYKNEKQLVNSAIKLSDVLENIGR